MHDLLLHECIALRRHLLQLGGQRLSCFPKLFQLRALLAFAELSEARWELILGHRGEGFRLSHQVFGAPGALRAQHAAALG